MNRSLSLGLIPLCILSGSLVFAACSEEEETVINPLAVDDDGDGYSEFDGDCDDTDPQSTIKADDADCDGVLTNDDCDDTDPDLLAIGDDADCDGVSTSADCDDTDPQLLAKANDADCDTHITASDCDDNEPLVSFECIQLAANHVQTCRLGKDGDIACWGWEGDAPGSLGWKDITLNSSHIGGCGITTSDDIECWGSLSDLFDLSTSPNGKIVDIELADYGLYALTNDGKLHVYDDWDGEYKWYEVGTRNGDFTIWQSVSSGSEGACGVLYDDSVECWGRLKNPPSEEAYRSVSVGGSHACALTVSGIVVCWGENNFGQSSPPTGTFKSIGAGLMHTCGVTEENEVRCWGRDDSGQSTAPSATFISVTAGPFHNCGVTTNGNTRCWGDNSNGQSSSP